MAGFLPVLRIALKEFGWCWFHTEENYISNIIIAILNLNLSLRFDTKQICTIKFSSALLRDPRIHSAGRTDVRCRLLALTNACANRFQHIQYKIMNVALNFPMSESRDFVRIPDILKHCRCTYLKRAPRNQQSLVVGACWISTFLTSSWGDIHSTESLTFRFLETLLYKPKSMGETRRIRRL